MRGFRQEKHDTFETMLRAYVNAQITSTQQVRLSWEALRAQLKDMDGQGGSAGDSWRTPPKGAGGKRSAAAGDPSLTSFPKPRK